MTAAEQDAAVIAYLTREADGLEETLPLAGLSLGSYRVTRARLVERGLLVRTTSGRYVPTENVQAVKA